MDKSSDRSSAAYEWSSLFRKPRLKDVSSVLHRFGATFWSFPKHIRNYFAALPKNPALRYKTTLLSAAILFASISILANANPFRLLWPGAAFPLPVAETRTYVSQLGLSRTSGKLVPLKRALPMEGSVEKRALQSLQLLSLPLDRRDTPAGANFQEIEALPNFSHAIRKIWFQNREGALIVDLRADTLEEELDSFFLNAPISEERRQQIASSWFRAATASLLMLDTKIKKVEFRLDGKLQKWSAIHFDLTRSYISGTN